MKTRLMDPLVWLTEHDEDEINLGGAVLRSPEEDGIDGPEPSEPEPPVDIEVPDELPPPPENEPPVVEIPTPEPAPEPQPEPPPVYSPAPYDPSSISAAKILEDRPDVLRGYYEAYYSRDHHSDAYVNRIGGDTPEAYAMYWYDRFGRYEGYNQGPTTAQDNISLSQILTDRPDVLRAFYEGYYGPNNDRHSSAWVDRVGGNTPEAYAKYWYEHFGRWEGYSQSEKAAAENIDIERLLTDRPDVMRAFYEQYYGPNNDRHSSAWVDRVGGDTVQDYAKYWYTTFGVREGYSQHAAASPVETPETPSQPSTPSTPDPDYRVEDPSLDPWNHPAIYPDWKPPYPGWRPPGSDPAPEEEPAVRPPEEDPGPADAAEGEVPVDPSMADLLAVGQSLTDPDPFG